MPFQKGHKLSKGRPPKIKKQVKDWIQAHPYAVAELMQVLYEQGIDGDREAATYIIDRVKGRPKQAIDQTIKGQILITPDMRALAVREMLEVKADEAKLLEGEYAVQEQDQGRAVASAEDEGAES
ncbi:hypothetical protein LCGC14_1863990 [marine sediment metagenome]|uniref:Uncharacterized protein n=1 Tax=marine sediment metagenome TaxID=412755 RepID=A0A0F9J5N1_9ZZZZ